MRNLFLSRSSYLALVGFFSLTGSGCGIIPFKKDLNALDVQNRELTLQLQIAEKKNTLAMLKDQDPLDTGEFAAKQQWLDQRKQIAEKEFATLTAETHVREIKRNEQLSEIDLAQASEINLQTRNTNDFIYAMQTLDVRKHNALVQRVESIMGAGKFSDFLALVRESAYTLGFASDEYVNISRK